MYIFNDVIHFEVFFKHTNSQHTNTQHTYIDTKKTKQAILVQQICIQEKISH